MVQAIVTFDIVAIEVNASYLKIQCEKEIEHELWEFFTYEIPGSQYDPRVKARHWDGKLHLYNKKTHQIYRGLLPRVAQWAKEHDYTFRFEYRVEPRPQLEPKSFVTQLDLPAHIKDRWYQYDCFSKAVSDSRNITELSTAAGKSLIIYQLMRYYNKPTLIVVHTLGLLTQMYKHFKEYGYDVETNVHVVSSGADKRSNKFVYLSTWQSIYEEKPAFFDKFEVVIGDEVHLFTAKSLQSILTNCRNAYHRFGFTGTVQEGQCHRLVLEGLFGSVFKPTTTRDLADEGWIAHPKVNIIVFDYPDNYRKFMHRGSSYGYKPVKYAQEMDFICRIPKRNQYIVNLALNLKGNTLILFRYIEKHGQELYRLFKHSDYNNPVNEELTVNYVDGGTDKEDREIIRQAIIAGKSSINICSYGVFSTGIDVPNLNNIIFASPYKSKQKVLQSIGRGLRLIKGKTHCNIYDLVDDLSYKNVNNHTLNHYIERIRYYNEEEFEYKQFRIALDQNKKVQR
jgi:superfamily II DNA or RNA helicase